MCKSTAALKFSHRHQNPSSRYNLAERYVVRSVHCRQLLYNTKSTKCTLFFLRYLYYITTLSNASCLHILLNHIPAFTLRNFFFDILIFINFSCLFGTDKIHVARIVYYLQLIHNTTNKMNNVFPKISVLYLILNL